MSEHITVKGNDSFTISVVQKGGLQTSGAAQRSTNQSSPTLDSEGMMGDKKLTGERLLQSIQSAIKSFRGSHTQLEFSEHEGTKRIMVKVVNAESGEIIREIPPEKNLDLLESLWEMAGILIDEKR